jgi:hypothetical protein
MMKSLVKASRTGKRAVQLAGSAVEGLLGVFVPVTSKPASRVEKRAERRKCQGSAPFYGWAVGLDWAVEPGGDWWFQTLSKDKYMTSNSVSNNVWRCPAVKDSDASYFLERCGKGTVQ